MFNVELLLIMLGYALLNGIGSLGFKVGLKRALPEPTGLIRWNRATTRTIKRLAREPVWVAGVAFLVADFFIYQVALSRYEVSVVKPLVNLNLVFVIALGVGCMKERLTPREGVAITVLIAGGILITFQSEARETRTDLGILLAIASVVAVVSVAGTIWLSRSTPRDRDSPREPVLEAGTPPASPKEAPQVNPRHEYFASLLSGLLYGLGALFNKALFEFFGTAWGMVALLGAGFGASYLGAFLLGQYAYARGRMAVSSPLVNLASIALPFVGGVLVFGELLLVPVAGEVAFPGSFTKLFGFGVTIAGILLAYHPRRTPATL